MAKSLRPCARKDAIRLLREAKGWGQQALADRAVVSIKTLNSVEQGKPGQLSTFGKIAKALGVEPSAFLEGHAPSPPPDAAEKRVEVRLLLSIPFEGLEESEGLLQLVGLISSLIQAKHAISVVDASSGSVRLTLRMSEEDVHALIKAAMALKLDEIGFRSLHVLDEDFKMPGNLPPILGLNEIFRLRKEQRKESRKKPGAKDGKRKKRKDS